MSALLVSILCSAAISHFFKLADTRGHRVFGIFLVNYAVATGTGVVQADLSAAIRQPPESIVLAVVLGLLFIAGFLSLRRGVETLGPSVATTLARVAVVLPIVASLVVFREELSAIQALGIVIGLIALPLAGRRRPWRRGADTSPPLPPTSHVRTPGPVFWAVDRSPTRRTPGPVFWAVDRSPTRRTPGPVFWAVVLFLIFGVNDFLLKVRVEVFPESDAGVFFAVLFGTAFLGSGVLFLRDRARLSWEEAALGMVVGVVNFGTAFFLSAALAVLPGVFSYTVNSLGIILVVTISSRLIWRERLVPHQYVFQGLSAAAIVLVNLPG